MYLTVTANAALDRILFIDRFIPGTVMRPNKMVESVGGKGLDSSVVLRALGQQTLALSFMAGVNGDILTGLLDGYGIAHDLITVEGETRIAHVVVETDYNRHSHLITAGHPVSPEQYQDLLDKFHQHAPRARYVIAAGSLPPGVPVDIYHTLICAARAYGVSTLIDCPGAPALAAIPAAPDVLKMNQTEFGQTFGVEVGTLDRLQQAAQIVYTHNHLNALVITCGEQGILAFTPEGNYRAFAPKQAALNAAGAGDGASACLAWRLSLGDDWPQALLWTAATSAAIVLTEGTADCRIADVHRIYPDVQVQPLG